MVFIYIERENRFFIEVPPPSNVFLNIIIMSFRFRFQNPQIEMPHIHFEVYFNFSFRLKIIKKIP